MTSFWQEHGSSFLPLFNVAVVLVILAALLAMVKAFLQVLKDDAQAPTMDESQVFGSIKSNAIAVRKKMVLTMREQPMYAQLVKAFPNHIILAQVSFSALLESYDQATKNRYNRKFADFVVCTKAFGALAIIELDDGSHVGREAKDAERDAFLHAAGYQVCRYRNIPNLQQLREDITPDAVKFSSRNEIAELDVIG